MTSEDLEAHADTVKVAILQSLANEKIIDPQVAEQWCETHTVISRKKSLFRTLSERWRKEETEPGNAFYLAVKRTT